jgi:hypothetical protein
MSEKIEQAEVPEGAMDKALTVIAPPFRGSALIVCLILALLGGVATGYSSIMAHASGAVDDRIEVKTGAKLDDHEKRITIVESDQRRLAADVSDMKGDIKVIRVILEQAVASKGRR